MMMIGPFNVLPVQVEASDLGLSVGYWPDEIALWAQGKCVEFKKMWPILGGEEVQGFVYITEDHYHALTIWND